MQTRSHLSRTHYQYWWSLVFSTQSQSSIRITLTIKDFWTLNFSRYSQLLCQVPSRFCHQASPWHKLLKHEEPCNWFTQQQQAFQGVKQSLLNPHTLAQYDDTKPISYIACDASLFGVRAVLSQILADGLEYPIAYSSHSLSSAEWNYSHLDKEALATIFGVTKFH